MRTYCIIAHGTLLNAQGDLHGKKIQKKGMSVYVWPIHLPYFENGEVPSRHDGVSLLSLSTLC